MTQNHITYHFGMPCEMIKERRLEAEAGGPSAQSQEATEP